MLCAAAAAHEVRPAYLQLTEQAEDHFTMVWKQPLLGDRRLAIEPVLPPACSVRVTVPTHAVGAALLEEREASCDLRSGSLQIRGLERTLTDVLVRIDYADGNQVSTLLRSNDPQLDLTRTPLGVSAYLALGFEHLLLGIDHILFVVALMLLINNRWSLVKAITAFTVAHSITLALSVLQLVVLPQGPIEASIALSILFLARELVVDKQWRSATARLRPWVVAFVFGLLHGFGFAGALAETGVAADMPAGQLAAALLLFNVGIELGQLLVIAILIGVGALFRLTLAQQATWAPRAFAAGLGIVAGFWTVERVAAVL